MNKDIEQVIIDCIEAEDGSYLGEDAPILQGAVDSFSFTMTLCSIDDELKCFPRDFFKVLDVAKLTPLDIERLCNENK